MPRRGRDGVLAIALGQAGQDGIPVVPTAGMLRANARKNAIEMQIHGEQSPICFVVILVEVRYILICIKHR